MRGFIVGLLIGVVLMLALGVVGLASIGHALAVEDPLEKADAIVAISGDTGARASTAVALWKQGLAPLIVFSGAAIDPASVSSAEIMRREALRQGVPESATLIEPASATTEANASEVAKLMVQRKMRSAILVTSPYHQRRACCSRERSSPTASCCATIPLGIRSGTRPSGGSAIPCARARFSSLPSSAPSSSDPRSRHRASPEGRRGYLGPSDP
jgi:uncharacterized SAM-binding protein YcdF (DUF218 family)